MAIGKKGQAFSAQGMVVCGFVLAALFAAEVRAARENGLPPRASARVTYSALVPEVLSGEVVLKTEVTKVTLAIDVAGPDGRGDGRVDHVFSDLTLRPIFNPIRAVGPVRGDRGADHRPAPFRLHPQDPPQLVAYRLLRPLHSSSSPLRAARSNDTREA